jgi:hypothetical protein
VAIPLGLGAFVLLVVFESELKRSNFLLDNLLRGGHERGFGGVVEARRVFFVEGDLFVLRIPFGDAAQI